MPIQQACISQYESAQAQSHYLDSRFAGFDQSVKQRAGWSFPHISPEGHNDDINLR